jgi:hypothetical protein
VEGDKLSLVGVRQFNGNEFRMNYKDTVGGGEIKPTIDLPSMDHAFEPTVKKASPAGACATSGGQAKGMRHTAGC